MQTQWNATQRNANATKRKHDVLQTQLDLNRMEHKCTKARMCNGM